MYTIEQIRAVGDNMGEPVRTIIRQLLERVEELESDVAQLREDYHAEYAIVEERCNENVALRNQLKRAIQRRLK